MSAVRSLRHELTRAVQELGLAEERFRILSEQEAVPIRARIEAHFVKEAGRRWWWEAFRDSVEAAVHYEDGSGWSHIARIVPPDSGLLWFVGEDFPEFILCEAMVDSVQAVLGDCLAFEYYVVSKDLEWLVGENHHDVVFAVGSVVVERLQQESSRKAVS